VEGGVKVRREKKVKKQPRRGGGAGFLRHNKRRREINTPEAELTKFVKKSGT